MKRLLLALLICGVFSVKAQPWFDHVRRPSELGHDKMTALASDLRTALKKNESLDKISALAPQEARPRVIFITIGGSKWPGRTYYGTGVDFQSAFKTAVDFLISNEPVFARETINLAKTTIEAGKRDKQPVSQEWHERMKNPGEWNWLRMDVVQYVQNVPQFSVPRSHIAMTSFCGIAFPPSMGFAFTPEQITARCLLNSNRTLDSGHICNIISEAYNWGALKVWMAVSADEEQNFPISLFEADTYYADENGATRLYRGHRLEYAPPTAQQCTDMANAAAEKLAQIIRPDGKIEVPFPVWYSSAKDEKEDNDVRLETGIALLRLYARTKKAETASTASYVMRPVIHALTPVGKALAVKEKEPLPDNASQVPRNITTVRTNALTAIAMMEMASNQVSYTDDASRPQPVAIAERLADYLAEQVENDGLVIDARFIPSGKPFTKDETFAKLEDAALVAIAIRNKYPDKAKKVIANILEKTDKQPIETLIVSPWIAEALACSGESDKLFTMKAIRFGYAAETSDTAPLYPDLYGAVRNYQGCTFSAKRTWTVAEVAKWLRSVDKEGLAAERMRMVCPGIIFHTQAFMDNAASSVMPSPAIYRGYFRDNLDEYSFNLEGQATQIMALTSFARELDAMRWPLRKLDVREARAASDVHPSVLQVTPVFTQEDMSNVSSRNMMGTFSGATEKKASVPVAAPIKK